MIAASELPPAGWVVAVGLVVVVAGDVDVVAGVVVVVEVPSRGGRVAFASLPPSVPTGRPNGCPVLTSTTTITVTGCGAGVTTCTTEGWKPCHCGPRYEGSVLTGSGSTNGLPQ